MSNTVALKHTRRTMLQVGSLGALGLTLPELLAAPVHVRDLFATIYHTLGFSHDANVFDPLGRPHFFIEGKVVQKLF